MRAFGEWEKQEALILALPHYNTDWRESLVEIFKSYVNFVKVVAQWQKVILISPNEEDFKMFFSKIPNVYFYQIQTDDTWIRDYGAIDVENAGRIISYDFIFNAWGQKYECAHDNDVNGELFKYFKGELRKIDMVLEGGSVDFNGRGTVITTSKCMLSKFRNPKMTKVMIEKKLMELFGLHTVIWLEHGYLAGDDTDSHVDTLARFISPSTIAYVGCDDKKDEHFTQLKEMEIQLKKTGFKLVKLPLPTPQYENGRRLAATYLNFVFVNGALIVPTYECRYDEMVIDILSAEIPDRVVVGVDSRGFIRQNGSLHCSSQNRFLGNR